MTENASVIDKLKNKYFLLVVALVSIAYMAFAASKQKDFYIFMLAAKDLFAGKDIYTLKYVDGYHFFYSVLFACFVYLLSFIPFYFAKLVWLLLNLYLLTRVVKIVAGYFNIGMLTVKEQWVFLGLCAVSCFKLVIQNFDCQQVTILILYLTLQGLESIWKGNKVWGALLIGLAINFKLLPLLLIPYLIYRREFKATLFIFIFYALFLELPALFIGTAQNNFLLASWWNIVNPTNPQHVLDTDEGGFNSLTTWLATLLVYQPPQHGEPNMARNIADISITQLSYVINAVRLLFLAFSLYFLRTIPFVKNVSKQHRFWEVSYFLLITPLLFPHQQFYSFLFAAPALCYIYYHFIRHYTGMSKPRYNLTIVAFALSFLLCNLSFLLGEYNIYYAYFKTLTYGVLLIVPLLAVSVPDKEMVTT